MNHYAEQQFVGLAINHPEVIAYDILPGDFQHEDHEIIWSALKTCKESHEILDKALFASFIEENLGHSGLTGYIHALSDGACINIAKAGEYAHHIKTNGADKRVDMGLKEIVATGGTHDEKQAKIAKLMKENATPTKSTNKTIREYTLDAVNEMQRLMDTHGLPGVSTGVPTMDKITGGFHKSDLIIIAARPSVGKTAMMVNLLLAAKNNVIGVISAEQPGAQIVNRAIAIIGNIDASHMRNPTMLSETDWLNITKAQGEIVKFDIRMSDKPAPTIADISEFAKGEPGIEILFVDYLQRIKGTNRNDSKIDQLGEVAQGLKELARDLRIPVVALAQINRSGAEIPRMENIKGSGDIEQEADIIAIIERNTRESNQEALLVLDKNRHGPTSIIAMHFEPKTMKFTEIDNRYHER